MPSPRLSRSLGCLLPLLLARMLLAANPIITEPHTADPAALVHKDTVYLYTGRDEAPPKEERYVMKEWLCFSSTDLVTWKSHGSPLSLASFSWADQNAWAGQVVEHKGKFYWFVPVSVKKPGGFAIGVAVSDSPTGPFVDALGKPMLTSDKTPDPTNAEGVLVNWDDIDPSVFIDDDGQAYLFWGNTNLYYARLKPSLTELDGPISKVEGIERFTEAPWVHKKNGRYYLTYATGFPERTAWASADKITGPWTYGGLLLDLADNCNTNHQAVVEFKGRSYLFYHNGNTPTGGSFRRSVCLDLLEYEADGRIKQVVTTKQGVAPVR